MTTVVPTIRVTTTTRCDCVPVGSVRKAEIRYTGISVEAFGFVEGEDIDGRGW